jgi:hypothetical protein
LNHAFTIEYAGNVVRDGRANLALATGWQVRKERKSQLLADCSEGIAVKGKEGSAAMKRI